MSKIEEIDGVRIVYSDLCQDFYEDGKLVTVSIVRLEAESTWTLEVEDMEGGSTVWDDKFPTDKAAWDEFMRTVDDEGIEAFQEDDKSRTSH